MRRFFTVLPALFDVLPPSSRIRLIGLIPLMIVAALLEMVGLALVLPLVNLVAGTDSFGGLAAVGGFQRIVEDIAGEEVLLVTGLAVAVFYVVKNIFLFATIHAENRFVMGAVRDAAVNLLSTYMAAPYVFHLRHNSAELIRNISSSVDDAFRGMMRPFLRMISEGMVIAGIFIVLLVADPMVTSAMSGFLALVLGGFFLLTHGRIASWGRSLQRLYKEALQALNETLASVKEVRILGRAGYFLRRYAHIRGEMSRIYALHQSVSELPRLVIETLLVFAFVLTLALVLARGDEGRQVLPLLALYAFAGFRLMPSFNRMIVFVNAIRFSTPSVDNVLAHRAEIGGPLGPPAPDAPGARLPLTREIVLDDVVFSYESELAPSVNGVTLRVARGQAVGLVGASGAGKTTLADVLLGLLEPIRGRILIDDVPVAGHEAEWQRNIGYIPQHIYLLDDTMRRNIALGVEDGDVDDVALAEAVRLARLEHVVRRLPNGIDTPLGERGARLSGGERQRVGIARALYHRPEVLVMDEATSALDNETEREIGAAIGALAGSRTLVVIAHRLSTIRSCDLIVLMRDGQVVDQGSYDQLIARCSDFKSLARVG